MEKTVIRFLIFYVRFILVLGGLLIWLLLNYEVIPEFNAYMLIVGIISFGFGIISVLLVCAIAFIKGVRLWKTPEKKYPSVYNPYEENE